MPRATAEDRAVAKQLANYCGIVFDYRRNTTPGEYENDFRDSLEFYLSAVLPELVSSTFAADVLDESQKWLKGFYERVPKDFGFKMNDIILNAYETQRRKLDTDETRGLMLQFVEDNRDLINLPVSEASDWVRKHWEKIYRDHIGEPPPPPESKLLNAELRIRLRVRFKATIQWQ